MLGDPDARLYFFGLHKDKVDWLGRFGKGRLKIQGPVRCNEIRLHNSLTAAHGGLAARARLNASGDNETGYLETLDEIVASGKVPAQRLLDAYYGEWNGDITRVYEQSF